MDVKNNSGRKIAIFGEIYSQNLGDGVIYDCMKHLFWQHGVNTIPVDLSGRTAWIDAGNWDAKEADVGLARRLVRIPLRRSRQLNRAISAIGWYGRQRHKFIGVWEEAIASSDAVVIGGGQLLTDLYFGFPPKIYEVARLAQLHRKPLAIFGCGAGSWGYVATKMYASVLRYASYVSVRDQFSASILSRFVSPNVTVDMHPDPVFSIKDVYTIPTQLVDDECLGFNLQPANHFRAFVPNLRNFSDENYCDFWVRLAQGACGSGKKIKFLSNGDPTDYAAAVEVVRALRNKGLNVALDSRPERPAELIKQISNTSSLVSTRMHAGIIAYGLGKNVIPISWDRKVNGVWCAIDQEQTVQSADLLIKLDPWSVIEPLLSNEVVNFTSQKLILEKINSAIEKCIFKLSIKN